MRILEVTPNADPELARALLDIQHAAYAREAISLTTEVEAAQATRRLRA